MTIEMSTVKVPKHVREELRRRAEISHTTQGEVIEALLAEAPAPNIDELLDETFTTWGPLFERLGQ